ncbi:MAG: PDZ domain-containing protein, partial [Cyanobacteria bacterium P01_E01_bin.48]
MTLTADTPSAAATPMSSIRQHYWVRMSETASHLFEIELRFDDLNCDRPFTLKFPVWTPGSYLVREYARHLQEFAVFDREDRLVPWHRIDKQTWEIDTRAAGDRIRVHYRLYAYDLTVRTNHLDTTHGFFTGAATFMYADERRQEPIQLTVCPPQPNWQIATALDPVSSSVPGEPQTFVARDFDWLVDSPVEVGLHQKQAFDVLDKPHEFVIWGHGNEQLERIVADTQKIIEIEAELFGGLPYDRYVFLLHLSASGGGGLEHKNSTVLNYPRFAFSNPERYDRFLSLVAHEFFHLWNIKRLRPEALEVFDYDRESYLSCLWFCEGTTSYYDTLILRRAGLISVETYLKLLGKRIGQLQAIPGRRIQSLVDSSFETWIKLYRQTENTSNSQVSYYLKGEVVTALLDLAIRDRSGNDNSLDTVMRELWQQFGQVEKGYSDRELREAFERAATTSLNDVFENYIEGTVELDYNYFLQPFGLQLDAKPGDKPPVPQVGLTLKAESGTIKISRVDMGSPAQTAGIWAGDELLALNGYKVTAETWRDRLRDYQPGQTVTISIFQREELKQVDVTLAEPVPEQYE